MYLTFRVIHSSHPTANTIMLVGIIGCFLAVLCIGIDGRFVTPWQFLIICQARAWTMTTGFTLAFGAMFSKVWRVHRLSTKAKSDQGKVSCKFEDDHISIGQSGMADLHDLIFMKYINYYSTQNGTLSIFPSLNSFIKTVILLFLFSSSLVTKLIFSLS